MAEETEQSWSSWFKDTLSTVLEVGLPSVLDGDSETTQQAQSSQYSETAAPVDNVSPISGGSFSFTKSQMLAGAAILIGAVVLFKVVK